MISATTIRKLPRRNPIGPTPLRSRVTWKAFLRAQASAIVLTDFLSVDTVFLKRLYVLLYMELATRRGIEVIRTPIAAPKANARVERHIGSTRRECLDWILIVNRRHLERVLDEWFEQYNSARPHRALGLRTPIARSDLVLTAGRLTCTERRGGLLRTEAREQAPAAA